MERRELLYQVLTSIEGFGLVTARKLLEIAGSVERLFDEAERISDFSPAVRRKIVEARESKALWQAATHTLDEAREKGIKIITLDDPSYPPLLRHCADAPLLLFFRGQSECLSSPHTLSVIGTRNATAYGRYATTQLLHDLKASIPDLLIVSGLAFGIDVAAHSAALEMGIPTVAVMAYGHDTVYPYEHRKVAREIAERGGMLSEYPPPTPVERHRFVARNRIVAGMASATIVIESALKGGALITAAMAIDYCRDVFALPGRITDRYSLGCNRLIAHAGAQAFTSSEDIIAALGWDASASGFVQPTLGCLQELPDDPILSIIAQQEAILFNDLLLKSDMPASQLSSKLFDLELEGYIESLPGGRYTLALR